jgi:hypothetical protein
LQCGEIIDALELKANIANGTATIERVELRSPLHRISFAGAAPLASGELDISAIAGPPQQAAVQAEPASATAFCIGATGVAPTVTPTAAPARK